MGLIRGGNEQAVASPQDQWLRLQQRVKRLQDVRRKMTLLEQQSRNAQLRAEGLPVPGMHEDARAETDAMWKKASADRLFSTGLTAQQDTDAYTAERGGQSSLGRTLAAPRAQAATDSFTNFGPVMRLLDAAEANVSDEGEGALALTRYDAPQQKQMHPLYGSKIPSRTMSLRQRGIEGFDDDAITEDGTITTRGAARRNREALDSADPTGTIAMQGDARFPADYAKHDPQKAEEYHQAIRAGRLGGRTYAEALADRNVNHRLALERRKWAKDIQTQGMDPLRLQMLSGGVGGGGAGGELTPAQASLMGPGASAAIVQQQGIDATSRQAANRLALDERKLENTIANDEYARSPEGIAARERGAYVGGSAAAGQIPNIEAWNAQMGAGGGPAAPAPNVGSPGLPAVEPSPQSAMERLSPAVKYRVKTAIESGNSDAVVGALKAAVLDGEITAADASGLMAEITGDHTASLDYPTGEGLGHGYMEAVRGMGLMEPQPGRTAPSPAATIAKILGAAGGLGTATAARQIPRDWSPFSSR